MMRHSRRSENGYRAKPHLLTGFEHLELQAGNWVQIPRRRGRKCPCMILGKDIGFGAWLADIVAHQAAAFFTNTRLWHWVMQYIGLSSGHASSGSTSGSHRVMQYIGLSSPGARDYSPPWSGNPKQASAPPKACISRPLTVHRQRRHASGYQAVHQGS